MKIFLASLFLVAYIVSAVRYDAIVIGVGASGSLACGKISELNKRVLCLENGHDVTDSLAYEHPSINSPFSGSHSVFAGVFLGQTENGKKFKRADTLGGGPQISGSGAIRPSPIQYEVEYIQRAGLDPTIWSYYPRIAAALKYIENYTTPFDNDPISPLRGTEGIINIIKLDQNFSTFAVDIQERFMAAFDQEEFNQDIGVNITGFGMFQRNLHYVPDGVSTRSTPWVDMLKPVVASRPNLTLLTGAKVSKIDVRNGKARAVRAVVNGKSRRFRLKANGKVILAAGPLNTPKILMLSGIGDCNRLADFGIECKSNLTHVGTHLKSHDVIYLYFYQTSGQDTPIMEGHFTTPWAKDGLHDAQIAVTTIAGAPILLVTLVNLRPDIIGKVDLRSHNPMDESKFTYSTKVAPGSDDYNRYLWMYDKSVEAMSDSFLLAIDEVAIPGPSNFEHVAQIYHHYSNAAPLGAVLNSYGEVHGVPNILVTDSSNIPGHAASHPAQEIYANTLNILDLHYPELHILD